MNSVFFQLMTGSAQTTVLLASQTFVNSCLPITHFQRPQIRICLYTGDTESTKA